MCVVGGVVRSGGGLSLCGGWECLAGGGGGGKFIHVRFEKPFCFTLYSNELMIT